MIAGESDQLALRDEPPMFTGGFDRYLGIVEAVDDEHRRRQAAERDTKRSLVGVVEVPGIGNSEHRVVQQTQVRRALSQDPQCAELRRVDDVIHVVVACQFHLLHANRGEHRQRCHPFGRQVGETERNTTAHAVTQHVDAPEAETIQKVNYGS